MTNKHILYGAEFSLYSGKARCYLRYKQVPFDEVLSSLSVYKQTIIPNTGVRFIPVVDTRWPLSAGHVAHHRLSGEVISRSIRNARRSKPAPGLTVT